MIKLIMTDIDGTLVPDGSLDINPEYFKVIEELTDRGIIFVVASGRHRTSIKEVFGPVMDKIWIASQNGNVLTHGEESKIIKPIPHAWGIELWEQLSKLEEIESVLSTPLNTYCTQEGTSMYDILINSYHYDTIATGSWDNIPNEDFSMMTLYHPVNVEEFIKKHDIRKNWEGRLDFLVSGKYWIDILMPGVNKSAALKYLCKELGIPREETIAFGDNLNDVSMVEYAGVGYAVDSAREETKKIADHVIPGYRQDGVLKILKSI